AGCPSVLDSSEISTENGRASRFPRPELEISFSPLQPNRMALRRQGEENAVTVKITRSARKRKSGEMEKTASPAGSHGSQSSIRSRKEGTLQKIGDFLQSSPTLLGTKAKKMMSLVSGRGDADSAASSSSLSLRAKKNKRKLYRPEISSPMDMPSHPVSAAHTHTPPHHTPLSITTSITFRVSDHSAESRRRKRATISSSSGAFAPGWPSDRRSASLLCEGRTQTRGLYVI
ncbi:Kinesin-like protein KIF20B, partial [Nibea albiflora]